MAPMIHEGAQDRGDARVATARRTGSASRRRRYDPFRMRRVAIHAKPRRIRERSVGPDGCEIVLLPMTPRAPQVFCRWIPLAVPGRVAEPTCGSPWGDTPVALRETGERRPPVGRDRPVVPPVALPDALRRPRRNGMGGVARVRMTIGAVEFLVEPVGGIVDLYVLFRSIGRHPQFEAVAKETPLLIRRSRGRRREGESSRDRPKQDGESSATATQRRTSRRR